MLLYYTHMEVCVFRHVSWENRKFCHDTLIQRFGLFKLLQPKIAVNQSLDSLMAALSKPEV